MTAEREYFTSRWGLLFSTLGMVIGAGNIWRFPRIVAQNGGGAFLLAWMAALFLWSIPILIIEFGVGRHTRLGVIGAFGRFLGGRFTWMGLFVSFCSGFVLHRPPSGPMPPRLSREPISTPTFPPTIARQPKAPC